MVSKSNIIVFYGDHSAMTIVVVKRGNIPQEYFLAGAAKLGTIVAEKDIIEIASNDETEYFKTGTPEGEAIRITNLMHITFPSVEKIRVIHESRVALVHEYHTPPVGD